MEQVELEQNERNDKAGDGDELGPAGGTGGVCVVAVSEKQNRHKLQQRDCWKPDFQTVATHVEEPQYQLVEDQADAARMKAMSIRICG